MSNVTLPFLFIDLDGTLRQPITGQWVDTPKNQMLLPGALEMLRKYKSDGFYIVVVSNQGGIAFGHKTPEQFEEEADYFCKVLLGGEKLLDDAYYSSSHPDGHVYPFNRHSTNRKPMIGMVTLAENNAFNRGVHIAWDKSLVVGDRPEDEGLAKNAGLRFMDAALWRKDHTPGGISEAVMELPEGIADTLPPNEQFWYCTVDLFWRNSSKKAFLKGHVYKEVPKPIFAASAELCLIDSVGDEHYLRDTIESDGINWLKSFIKIPINHK